MNKVVAILKLRRFFIYDHSQGVLKEKAREFIKTDPALGEVFPEFRARYLCEELRGGKSYYSLKEK